MKKKNMMRRMACSFAAKYAVNEHAFWRFEKQAILSVHEKNNIRTKKQALSSSRSAYADGDFSRWMAVSRRYAVAATVPAARSAAMRKILAP